MSKADDPLATARDAAENASTPDDATGEHRNWNRSVMFSLRLTPEELDELQRRADERGLPVRTLARAWLLRTMRADDSLDERVTRLEGTVFHGRTGTPGVMGDATEGQIVQYADVLTTLATRNGLTNLRRAGEGHVVADIAAGRTYFDVARFELDAESLLGARVDVILSGAPAAAEKAEGPLVADEAT